MRLPTRVILAMVLAAAGSSLAAAETPLRVIVPFAAGGGGDLLARILAPEISRDLGVAVLVENLPGANGAVGMQRVKNAAQDERVVVLASDHATMLSPQAAARAGYDMREDFRVVGYAASYPYALAVASDPSITTLAQFRFAMGATKAPVNIAVPAVGGVPEAIAVALSQYTGAPAGAVPFRGGQPAALALLGGHVTAAAVGLSNVLAMHRKGQYRILAVTGDKRSPTVPEVPTFQEAGVAGLEARGGWAFYAARNTSMPLATLNRILRGALARANVQAKLRGIGLDPAPMDLAQSERELAHARAAWSALREH